MSEFFDVIIVGGGIAGASLGAEIAAPAADPDRRGRGRIAAIIRPAARPRSSSKATADRDVAELTIASGPFLDHPPADFSERGFLHRRGAVHLSDEGWPELPPIGRGAAIVDEPNSTGWCRASAPRWTQGACSSRAAPTSTLPPCTPLICACSSAPAARSAASSALVDASLRRQTAGRCELADGATLDLRDPRRCRRSLGRSRRGGVRAFGRSASRPSAEPWSSFASAARA